jgi:hypothetical protein
MPNKEYRQQLFGHMPIVELGGARVFLSAFFVLVHS